MSVAGYKNKIVCEVARIKAVAGTEDHSKLSIIEKEYDIPIEENLQSR